MPREVRCPSCGGPTNKTLVGRVSSLIMGGGKHQYTCQKCRIKFTPKPELAQKPGHPEIVTLSGAPRCDGYAGPAPCPIDPKTGMHQDYWVLSEEERAKGFVKPVRRSYMHVGIRPKFPLRELTAEEHTRYDVYGYSKFEAYPEPTSVTGRFWTEKMLTSGCGSITTMAVALAETYARNPHFYGATFCANCRTHFPLEEFVWVGANRRLEENMDPNLAEATV